MVLENLNINCAAIIRTPGSSEIFLDHFKNLRWVYRREKVARAKVTGEKTFPRKFVPRNFFLFLHLYGNDLCHDK